MFLSYQKLQAYVLCWFALFCCMFKCVVYVGVMDGVCTHVWVGVLAQAHTPEGQRRMPSVFLYRCPLYCFETVPLSELEGHIFSYFGWPDNS